MSEAIKVLEAMLVEHGHAPDLQQAKELVESGVVRVNGHTIRETGMKLGAGWEYVLHVGMSMTTVRF
jgi:ribosomal protein S4